MTISVNCTSVFTPVRWFKGKNLCSSVPPAQLHSFLVVGGMLGYGRIPIKCEVKSLAGFKTGLYIYMDNQTIQSYFKQCKN